MTKKSELRPLLKIVLGGILTCAFIVALAYASESINKHASAVDFAVCAALAYICGVLGAMAAFGDGR